MIRVRNRGNLTETQTEKRNGFNVYWFAMLLGVVGVGTVFFLIRITDLVFPTHVRAEVLELKMQLAAFEKRWDQKLRDSFTEGDPAATYKKLETLEKELHQHYGEFRSLLKENPELHPPQDWK